MDQNSSYSHVTRFSSVILALMVFSCGSETTQQERYQEVISGISYRSYKATAGKTSASVIKLYNDQKPDTIPPLKESYAHLLLGYMWTVSGQSAMAFAEADLAEEGPETEVKILAVALRSISLYEMGLDSLGKEESESIHKYVPESGSRASYEATTFYLLMGLVKLYENSPEESKFFWAGFANETGIHWPFQLTDAFSDFQKGDVQQSLQKIKKLSQDSTVPAGLRQELGEFIENIEENSGDVSSPFFWPRLISKTIYHQLKESASSEMNSVLNAVKPGA